MPVQLVIFDLDGTLLNTIPDLAAAANHAMTHMGMPTHTIDQYATMVGNGIRMLLTRALPETQRDDNTIDHAVALFTQYYDQHLYDATKPYPGIIAMLDNLHERGIALAVASNKYSQAVAPIIAHFFGHIPWAAVEGNTPDRPRKPHPAIVQHILQHTNIAPQDTLYVGDSTVDILTAQAAGTPFVGVTWGFAGHKPFDGTTLVTIDHPLQLLNHIQ